MSSCSSAGGREESNKQRLEDCTRVGLAVHVHMDACKIGAFVHVGVRACASVCICAHVCMCLCARAHICVRTHATARIAHRCACMCMCAHRLALSQPACARDCTHSTSSVDMHMRFSAGARITFWRMRDKQFPALAVKLLCMHSTACASERNWSAWGQLFSAARQIWLGDCRCMCAARKRRTARLRECRCALRLGMAR